MKTKTLTLRDYSLLLTLAFSLQPSALLWAAPLGTAFSYQGKLAVGTEVVAPEGSTVYGKLTSAQQAGRVVGKTELQAVIAYLQVLGTARK